MSDWQSIDTYDEDMWRSETVEFRGSNGQIAVGSYGFEDEVWDGEDEWLIGGYHLEDEITPLGFEPVEWRKIEGRNIAA